ncbi:MAG: S1 RNA-binding domain-containing protein [Chloroflexota bacterium]
MSEETTPNESNVEEVEVQEVATEAPVAEQQPEAEAPEEPVAETAPEEPAAEAEAPEEPVTAEAVSEEPAAEAPEEPVAETAPEEPAAQAGMTIEDLKPGMGFDGRVKAIELYGAFVDIGVGKDALLHISQLGKPNIRNVEDVVKAGETITVYVMKVDVANERIALSLEKPPENPIGDLKVGDIVTGKVVRIENFGVFVDIGAERPGMVHVSELAMGFVKSPEDVVSMEQEVQVRVIKVNRKKRQIDLSIKALEEEQVRADTAAAMAPDEDDEPMPTAMEMALRRALTDSGEGVAVSDKRSNNKKSRNSKKSKKALQDALERTLKEQSN